MNMSCHLIELAKDKKLEIEESKKSLEYTEKIFCSDKFDVSICRCKDCGQVFVYCFKEYNTADWEDYYWTFWIPATDKDIEELKQTKILIKFMGEMISTKSHICWGDNNTVYWTEGGNPIAYIIFLPI